MEQNSLSANGPSNRPSESKHITAFSAVKCEHGLQIKVAGCVPLHPAQNGSESVIGVVELDDQVVPVLDARPETSDEITNLCCIVLFENVVGDTTIVTGRLYESACQVFDLIVEQMDHPEENEDHLYMLRENSTLSETAQ